MAALKDVFNVSISCEESSEGTMISHARRSKSLLRAEVFTLWISIAIVNNSAALGKTPFQLILPPSATITLVNRRTISGVRMKSLSPDRLEYVKAGVRSVSLDEVHSISFYGASKLRKRIGPRLRGVNSDGCQDESKRLSFVRSALETRQDGDVLVLIPNKLNSVDPQMLRTRNNPNRLVVNTILFDPPGFVKIKFLLCRH
jgi:hypothetical protein